METYLFIALLFIYILTSFILPKQTLKKIWTLAYIVSFMITGISIFYIKLYATDTLMKVGELNWYYILYIFGSISIILGVINLWLYKKSLYTLFTNSTPPEKNWLFSFFVDELISHIVNSYSFFYKKYLEVLIDKKSNTI